MSTLSVLVLAPHTDDEIGCAGTMARYADEGYEVHYRALSACEESVPDGFSSGVLRTECAASMKVLAPATWEVWNFQVRHFPAKRQEILERFVALHRELQPQIVLCPASNDFHQDHATVASEATRAFRHATLWGYEMPQNLVAFRNTAFVEITDVQLARKLSAIREYHSQQHRSFCRDEFANALAIVRGAQARSTTGFAEAFEVVRHVERCGRR